MSDPARRCSAVEDAPLDFTRGRRDNLSHERRGWSRQELRLPGSMITGSRSRKEAKMKSLVARAVAIPVVWALFFLPVVGQGSKETESTEKADQHYEKIEMEDHWFFGPRYKVGGKKIGSGEAEALIYSIEDGKAEGHLRMSRTYGIASLVVITGGTVLSLLSISTRERGFNSAMFWSGFGITAVGYGVGDLSKNEIAKAVYRYNKVLKDKYGISFHWAPESGKAKLQLEYSY